MSVEETEKKVYEWVDAHREDIIEFLRRFTRYRSPTGKELEVQRDFVKPFFEKEMHWDEIDYFSVAPDAERPNVNGRWKGAGGGRNLHRCRVGLRKSSRSRFLYSQIRS